MTSRSMSMIIRNPGNGVPKGPVMAKPLVAKRQALGSIDNKDKLTGDAKPKKAQASKTVVRQEKQLVKLPSPAPMNMSKVEEITTAFSNQHIGVEDVDAEDVDNPQLVSIYVNEIYDYLHMLEQKYLIKPDFLKGQVITGRMRAILIDWLCQVASRFQLLQESFYLTVDIIDRFLQVQEVSKNKLQLVGVTAMFIASKYEEMYSPPISDFAYIADHAYKTVEIKRMEIVILKTLDFNLGKPLPLHFLRRNSKAGEVDATTHTLAKYLMELTVADYDMAHYTPSVIAASALCLAMKLLYSAEWTPTLVHYSKYAEKDLTIVMSKLARLVLKTETQKLQAIRQKYASSKFMKISCIPELKSEKIKKIAGSVP